MKKSMFHIKKMDCPSEENLIRLKLEEDDSISNLVFNIEARELSIYHEGDEQEILKSLETLALDTELVHTQETNEVIVNDDKLQSRLLWQVLLINFLFFVVEMTFGLISKSMGLVADSLDMLSDSFVYGLSLFAVGSAVFKKKKIARLSGYIQIGLALIGVLEVFRRYFLEDRIPEYSTMIIVSVFALLANWLCLYLLQKSKSEEAHMKASMIFTSNDIIINIGVIIAGILVSILSDKLPDLIIGTLVFLIVLRGAFRILKLAK
ncbi:cation transporter [Paracrocinitomix mangrovi]|uniref:cation transporter n=1 Tax=Paracrocinitomix mangrovi TaxID=2862509 RepID=UPI001C8DD215|nr:cation transporter [Paracrocinitomix mangrovi]UKN01094.1 cation transporter [Paracrocinitomix mangrovi]